jgi:nitroreductase
MQFCRGAVSGNIRTRRYPRNSFTSYWKRGCVPRQQEMNDRSLLEGITEFHAHSQMLKQAPAAIIVCADMNRDKYPTDAFWVQDCAAATENILITARDKGLGTCWLGVYPKENRMAGMSKLLNIPGHIVPFSAIAVGYPAAVKSPGSRYDESRVHYNHW